MVLGGMTHIQVSHSNNIEGVLNFWPHTYNSGYAIDLRKEQMSRKENKVKKI